MFLRTETLAPGVMAKITLVADCAVLAVASAMCATAPGGSIHRGAFVVTSVAAMTVWLSASRGLRQYDVWKKEGLAGDLALTSVLVLGVTGALALLRAALPSYADATSLNGFLMIAWPGTLLVRALAAAGKALSAPDPRDVLIVGTGPLGRHTAAHLEGERTPLRSIGYLAFSDEVSTSSLAGTVVGHAVDLERVLSERPVSEVFLAGNALRHADEIQTAIRVCERHGTPFALPACPFRMGRGRPAGAHAISDGYVHYLSTLDKPIQSAAKRVIDIVASAIALVLLSPILVGIAVAITVTSPGPIIFRQPRVGRFGRPFHMLKFRSMVIDAEARKAALLAQNERSGPAFKIKNDPRVTAVGRFIRKFSLDELPQFLNVLRGDMSLVGPRPPIPSEVARYEPWQRRRLSVRPGITCLWQVSGRDRISFEEWMYLDMRYIDHWSLAEDLKLILKTVPVVVTGRGAS